MRPKETREVVEMIKRIEAGGGGGGGYEPIDVTGTTDIKLYELEPNLYKIHCADRDTKANCKYTSAAYFTVDGTFQQDYWLFIADETYNDKQGRHFYLFERKYLYTGSASAEAESRATLDTLRLDLSVSVRDSAPSSDNIKEARFITVGNRDYQIAVPEGCGYTVPLHHAYDSGSRELVEDEDDDTALWNLVNVLWDETDKPIFPSTILFDTRDGDGNGTVKFCTIQSMVIADDTDSITIVAANNSITATITSLPEDDSAWYITITQNS